MSVFQLTLPELGDAAVAQDVHKLALICAPFLLPGFIEDLKRHMGTEVSKVNVVQPILKLIYKVFKPNNNLQS